MVYTKSEFKNKVIKNLEAKLKLAEELNMDDKVANLKHYIKTCNRLVKNAKHNNIHVIGLRLLSLINEDTKNWHDESTNQKSSD